MITYESWKAMGVDARTTFLETTPRTFSGGVPRTARGRP